MKFIDDGTAGAVMHPSRFKILQLLRQSKEPLFVEQISKELHIHPRMVSHHLDVLQELGLVESRYEVVNLNGSKRGVAVRMCFATPKVDEVLRQIRESVG
jgi:DNA-binding transcriptional ArsR family regulator